MIAAGLQDTCSTARIEYKLAAYIMDFSGTKILSVLECRKLFSILR